MEQLKTLHPLRRGLLALSALGVVGTMAELASLGHWHSLNQMVPWFVLAATGAAILAAVFRPGLTTVRVAFAIGLVMAVAGFYGVIVHVVSNYQAAPLDGTVGPTWDSMTLIHKLWLASTGGVGPTPPLAAGSLAPTGLALALATYRHPALTGQGEPELEEITAAPVRAGSLR